MSKSSVLSDYEGTMFTSYMRQLFWMWLVATGLMLITLGIRNDGGFYPQLTVALFCACGTVAGISFCGWVVVEISVWEQNPTLGDLRLVFWSRPVAAAFSILVFLLVASLNTREVKAGEIAYKSTHGGTRTEPLQVGKHEVALFERDTIVVVPEAIVNLSTTLTGFAKAGQVDVWKYELVFQIDAGHPNLLDYLDTWPWPPSGSLDFLTQGLDRLKRSLQGKLLQADPMKTKEEFQATLAALMSKMREGDCDLLPAVIIEIRSLVLLKAAE